MNNSSIIGFRHTGIIVKDADKSKSFYMRFFGLKEIQDWVEDSVYLNNVLGLSDGKIRMVKLQSPDGYIIELLQYKSHPTQESSHPFYNVGTCHIAVTVQSAEQMYQKLTKENIKVISKPLVSSEKTAKLFFCEDPDGIRIEIVEIIK